MCSRYSPEHRGVSHKRNEICVGVICTYTYLLRTSNESERPATRYPFPQKFATNTDNAQQQILCKFFCLLDSFTQTNTRTATRAADKETTM